MKFLSHDYENFKRKISKSLEKHGIVVTCELKLTVVLCVFFSENPKLHLWCLSREFDSRFSQEPTKIRSLGQVCVRCAFYHIFMCFEKLLWNEFHGKVIRGDAKLKKSIPVLLFIAHNIWIVRKGSVTFKAAGSVLYTSSVSPELSHNFACLILVWFVVLKDICFRIGAFIFFNSMLIFRQKAWRWVYGLSNKLNYSVVKCIFLPARQRLSLIVLWVLHKQTFIT